MLAESSGTTGVITLLAGIATVASAIFAGFAAKFARQQKESAVTAAKAAADSLTAQRAIAIATTVQWCTERYMEIEKYREIVVDSAGAPAGPGGATAKRYFEQLWNLHYIECQLYARGFIPSRIYALWLSTRNREYFSGLSIGGMSQRDGWTHAAGYISDQAFTDFISDSVINCPKNHAALRGT